MTINSLLEPSTQGKDVACLPELSLAKTQHKFWWFRYILVVRQLLVFCAVLYVGDGATLCTRKAMSVSIISKNVICKRQVHALSFVAAIHRLIDV